MIFKDELCQRVLYGTKTQTRRLVKNNEYTWFMPESIIVEVCDSNNRLKWRVGNNYAVQPGRGRKAVGRIKIIKIQREQLQDISEGDCHAEGVLVPTTHGRFSCHIEGVDSRYIMPSPIPYFAELWNSIHPKGKRWEDNPHVWVLEFELVREAQ